MFGVNVIAERAIADQGIMILGVETLDANFTQTTEQNFISPASLDIIGNSEFSAFAAGTAAGYPDARRKLLAVTGCNSCPSDRRRHDLAV